MDLAAQTDLSIVIPPGIEQLVSLELLNISTRAAFELLASQVDLSVTVQDETVVFLEKGEVAQAIAVYRPGFGTVESAVETLTYILSGQARVTGLDDRVVVSGTRAAVQLADSVMMQYMVGPDAWLIEVRLVELSSSLRRALGFDWSAAGNASVGIDGTTGFEVDPEAISSPLFGARAQFSAQVIAEAAMNSTDATLHTHATLYLLEGSESKLQLGQVVPYPSRSVLSESGQLVTRDFERIDTGFVLNASSVRVPGGIRLTLDPTISEVTGFVDQVVPIVAQRSVSATVMMRSGDWVILSGFDQSNDAVDRSHSPFPFDRESKQRDSRSLHVLVRAVRIDSAEHQRGNELHRRPIPAPEVNQ